MKIFKYLVCVFLTFSMITQSFAQTAIDAIHSKHIERQSFYNQNPIFEGISIRTDAINNIFAREPGPRPEPKDRMRVVEIALKTVMGTAIIHGNNKGINLPAAGAEGSSSYAHFEILRITQMFSQTMVNTPSFLAQNTKSNIHSAMNAVINRMHKKEVLESLTKYSGVSIDVFSGWFATVYMDHAAGLAMPGAAQLRVERGSGGSMLGGASLSSRAEDNDIGAGGSAVARDHSIQANPFSVNKGQIFFNNTQAASLEDAIEIYLGRAYAQGETSALKALLSYLFNTSDSTLSREEQIEKFKAVLLPEYKKYLAEQAKAAATRNRASAESPSDIFVDGDRAHVLSAEKLRNSSRKEPGVFSAFAGEEEKSVGKRHVTYKEQLVLENVGEIQKIKEGGEKAHNKTINGRYFRRHL